MHSHPAYPIHMPMPLSAERYHEMNLKRSWSASIDLLTGNNQPINALQCNFIDPGNYTIQFGIIYPGPVAGNQVAACAEAIVTWSTEGNNVRRRVSVTNGLSITGSANAATIQLVDVTNSAFPAGVKYSVFMTVSKGVRGSSAYPPTLTETPGVVGANAKGLINVPTASQTTLAIPQDAGPISVLVTAVKNKGVGIVAPIVNGEALVFQANSFGTAIRAWDVIVDTSFVPLAPNASSLTMQNHGTDSIIFSIAYGIDG